MRNTCGVAHLVAFLVCEVVDRFSKTPKGEGRVLQFPIVDVGGNYPLKKKIARASVLCFFFIAISPAALDYRNSSLNRKELAAVAARKCAPLPSAPVQFQPAFPACWPCESEKKKRRKRVLEDARRETVHVGGGWGGEANVKGCGRWELARRPLGLLSFSSSISLSLSLTSAPDFAL